MAPFSRALRDCLLALVLAGLAVGLMSLPVWAEDRKLKKYAVLVGVREYAHPKLRNLQYTENDVVERAALLHKHGNEVTLLGDGEGKKDAKRAPTKANVERQLKRVLDASKKEDLVLVGLSGHGL